MRGVDRDLERVRDVEAPVSLLDHLILFAWINGEMVNRADIS